VRKELLDDRARFVRSPAVEEDDGPAGQRGIQNLEIADRAAALERERRLRFRSLVLAPADGDLRQGNAHRNLDEVRVRMPRELLDELVSDRHGLVPLPA